MYKQYSPLPAGAGFQPQVSNLVRQRVVANGVEGGGLLLAAGEAEGGDGGEGVGDREPWARLEEDVGAVHKLQRDREARHRAAGADADLGRRLGFGAEWALPP
jgi:hypothetical protein